MKKSFEFVLLTLLVVPLLLTGCSGETPDVAEDYVEALLQGDAEAAQQVACEAFQSRTGELAALFGQQDLRNFDLKYDVGKGGREEEVIVTGSFDYGPEDSPRQVKLQERDDTRIVVWLEKSGDDWCVADTTEVGEGLLTVFGSESTAAVTDEAPADDAAETEEATEEETEEAAEDAE
jgi:hypothetical protein